MSRAAQTPQVHAEVLKLARLLQREPASLAYLEPLDPADLRALRERVAEALFDSHSGSLSRIAAASRLLPVGLSASLGQTVFGPLLSARLTGLLDPGRAVEMAAKLPPVFLADVAVELDPRHAADMIVALPAERVAAATAELVARGEYVTMGGFVAHLSPEAMAAAVATMDDRSLLEVVFVLEDKAHLADLVAILPEGRIAGVVAAAAENDLWVQTLDLLDHMLPEQRATMVAASLALDPPPLDAILSAVIAHELWEAVLPIAEHDAALQAALADRIAQLPARRRAAVARCARKMGMLERLGPLGQALAA